MGTDIHLETQIFTGSKWVPHKDHEALHYRNYDLFAVLAGVRNGCGFAGCLTGIPVLPIAAYLYMKHELQEEAKEVSFRPDDNFLANLEDKHSRRGLPDEMRKRKNSYDYDFGDHSFNWLLYSEILEYPWDKNRCKVGIVTLDEYLTKYKHLPYDQRDPDSYCGGVGGPNVIVLDEPEYETIVKSNKPLDPKLSYNIRMAWVIPIRSCASGFLKGLEEVFGDNDPKKCRIVFGFDS